MDKKQVTGNDKKRSFFDRKVQRQEKYQALAVTKLIPDDWDYVRLRKIDESPDIVIIQVRCLLRREHDAPG